VADLEVQRFLAEHETPHEFHLSDIPLLVAFAIDPAAAKNLEHDHFDVSQLVNQSVNHSGVALTVQCRDVMNSTDISLDITMLLSLIIIVQHADYFNAEVLPNNIINTAFSVFFEQFANFTGLWVMTVSPIFNCYFYKATYHLNLSYSSSLFP